MRYCFILIYLIQSLTVAEVQSHYFVTDSASQDFNIPDKFKQYEKLFARALKTSPEELIITSAVALVGTQLGLSDKDALDILRESKKAYKSIRVDKDFQGVSSSLPYCFSKGKAKGHYFIYEPDQSPEGTVLFLHGFGGNFLFYIQVLKNAFPKYRVIAPSYGVSWSRAGIKYLDDMLKDVEARFGKLDNFWLMAISGGGPIGFEYYKHRFKQVKGLVCLASSPLKRQLEQINSGATVLMLNGRDDNRTLLKRSSLAAKVMSGKIKNFKTHNVAGSHFFLLTDTKETMKMIKSFMGSH